MKISQRIELASIVLSLGLATNHAQASELAAAMASSEEEALVLIETLLSTKQSLDSGSKPYKNSLESIEILKMTAGADVSSTFV